MSSQLFVTLYTLYSYPSAHKPLRRNIPNPFMNSPVFDFKKFLYSLNQFFFCTLMKCDFSILMSLLVFLKFLVLFFFYFLSDSIMFLLIIIIIFLFSIEKIKKKTLNNIISFKKLIQLVWYRGFHEKGTHGFLCPQGTLLLFEISCS